MMDQPTKPKEAGVFRGVASAAGLFVGLLPAMAQAQTNIDQGKSPAEIFATDCATCHKSARGLANGRGSSGLASFLVEHYTASKDQAAALAAYVMGAGGGEAAPAARGPKPATATDRNRASTEPPPTRLPGKPDQTPPAAGRQGPQPATASRNRRVEPASTAPGPQPAAVVAEPAPPSTSVQESPAAVPGPSAAAPTTPESDENAPVPRDNIPD
jgi:mono/diheme cytochrome c family protein